MNDCRASSPTNRVVSDLLAFNERIKVWTGVVGPRRLFHMPLNGGMDTRTQEQRTHIMRSVRSKHTGPEMVVRRLVHSMGFRYRLHQKRLPGRPDIVLPRLSSVIFVNGCFWHGHKCSKGRLPKS